MIDLEKIAYDIGVGKSQFLTRWMLPIVTLEEMIALIRKQEAALAAPQQHAQAAQICESCGGQGATPNPYSPPNMSKCFTCSGHGLIGGLMPGDGGYHSEDCPACDGTGNAQAALSDELPPLPDALAKLPWTDQSTADPITKANRVLEGLADASLSYFFHDGYPRDDIAKDAKNVQEVLKHLAASQQPVAAPTTPWSFCPECGSEEIHHEEGEHKQCAICHQEWFSSIDYTDVIRKHLGEWKAAPVADAVPLVECAKCNGQGATHYPDGEWEGKCLACKGTGIQPPADAAPEAMKLLQDAARAWNNEQEAELDATMERIESFLISQRKVQPSTVQGDARSQEVAKRTLIEIDADIANGGGLGRMDRMLKERAALLDEPLFQQGRASGIEEAVTVVKNVPTMAGGSAQQNACIAAILALNK